MSMTTNGPSTFPDDDEWHSLGRRPPSRSGWCRLRGNASRFAQAAKARPCLSATEQVGGDISAEAHESRRASVRRLGGQSRCVLHPCRRRCFPGGCGCGCSSSIWPMRLRPPDGGGQQSFRQVPGDTSRRCPARPMDRSGSPRVSDDAPATLESAPYTTLLTPAMRPRASTGSSRNRCPSPI